MFARKRALQPTRAVVNRFERKTITAEALGEKPTQLNIIFDDKKSFHLQHPTTPILAHRNAHFSCLYKTLCC